MPTLVRPGRPDDAATLADYNAAMALETEGHALDRPTLDAGVRAALADANKARYFVAEVEGRVAGMLMITLEWSDWRNGEIWWIESVYVHPDFRRLGVFTALYGHVEALAKQSNVIGLRLYVMQDNLNAQQTYRRLGMDLSGYLVMENLKLRD